MIPVLFEASYPNAHSSFEGHGLGDLIDATGVAAKESAEDGHEWELSFDYPETGELFADIRNGAVVVAKVNSYQRPQAFRIYSIKKNLNHTINVSCQHIYYDLASIPVKPFKVENASDALEKIVDNKAVILSNDHFSFSTDIPDPTPDPTTDYYILETSEPKSMLSLLVDGDDAICGKYGGDLVIDNYTIKLKQIAGQNRSEVIEYGKDLTSFDQEENISDLVTGILPYYVKESNSSLSLSTSVNASVTQSNVALVTADKEYTLESGYRYKLSFYTDARPGSTAYLNPACGFLASGASGVFDLDGTRKDFEIEIRSNATYPANTVLVYSGSLGSGSTNYGELYDVKVDATLLDPIIYGSVAYGPGTYDVQKIKPVDLSSYFASDPTLTELNAKAAEWVSKEEIGIPEINLTISYANLGQDIRLYDAVRVRFVKMGVDATAKVTSYSYDVLREVYTEISIGKAKDSLYFTLEDASRLRKGVLPPDRIGKKSITSDKYAKGSIKSDSIAAGGVNTYNIEQYSINADLIGQKAVGTRHFKRRGDGKDPVLISVPDNVYGTYDGEVGYLFDPSLGVDWLQIPGWKDAQGHVIKPVTYHKDIPYNPDGSENPPGSKHAWGYMLDPNFIFNGSLDAEKKVTPKSITATQIKDYTITNIQIAEKSIDWRATAQDLRDKWNAVETKTANFGKIIGPAMAIDTASDYSSIETLQATFLKGISLDLQTLGAYIRFPAHDTGILYSPHTLTVDGSTIHILSDGNMSFNIPDYSTTIAGMIEVIHQIDLRVQALEEKIN